MLVASPSDDEEGSSDSAEDDSPVPDRKSSEDASSPSLTTIGWLSLGVAAVATGTAVVLGLETLSARDDYNASKHTSTAARNRATNFMHWTNIAWATAAITGVGGATILLLAPSDAKSGAVVVQGRF